MLLLKNRAVMAAVAAASLVLGYVSAVTPLFVSSAANAAVGTEIERRCAGDVGGTFEHWTTVASARAQIADLEATTTAFGDPILTLEVLPGVIETERGDTSPVRFLHRTGFTDHITVVETVDGPGLWLSSRGAEYLGLSAGDTVNVFGAAQDVLVAGVYRDLNEDPRTDYWCSYDAAFLPAPPFDDLPPPLVLLSDDLYLELLVESEDDHPVVGTWELPVPGDGITLADASAALSDLERWHEELGHAERGFRAPRLRTDLRFITSRASALREGLASSVVPVAGAVRLVGLALVGVAAAFWVERRRAELVFLASRGTAPLVVGAKACLEMLLALILGGVLGWWLAVLSAGLLGPIDVIETGARREAARSMLTSLILGLGVVWVVVSARAGRLLEEPRASRIPWRMFGFGAAFVWVVATVLSRLTLGGTAIAIVEGDEVTTLSPLVLAFPVLAFGTALLVVAFLLRWSLARLPEPRTASGLLVSRRVTSRASRSLILIAAWALPVAVAVYAASLTLSSTATVEAKALTFVGGQTSVAMLADRPIPPSIEDRATRVVRIERLDADGIEIDVLGIDPETFARAAFWDPNYADVPLDQLLAELETEEGPLSAIVVASDERISQAQVRGSDVILEFDVRASAEAFPGMKSARPLVVTHLDALSAVQVENGLTSGALEYVWTDVSLEETDAAWQEALMGYRFLISSDGVLDQLKYSIVIWTFSYLRMMALLAAMVTVVAVVLHADTTQRGRSLSYAMVRRMGLSRRDHARVVFTEYTLVLGAGSLVGVGIGLLATLLIYRFVDPVPGTPPAPRLALAYTVVLACLAGGFGLAALAAWTTQRAADNTDIAEVLRHGA